MENKFNLRLRMLRKDIDPLKFTGDWVDIRVADVSPIESINKFVGEDYQGELPAKFSLAKGTSVLIRHGFALELPKGYEALVRPRGSLFKKTGMIFTSSGVIDEGYSGDKDEWFTSYYLTKDILLHAGDRIAQFRIFKKQPELSFTEVAELGNKGRGGLGSTGGYHE